ncbi:MAG: helix-turn-helix transcriptional regulator [Gammaproteobacteria bacterium]
MDITEAFGRAVKARRAEVGITQEDLADKAEVARSFVSAMERGEKAPTIRTVWRLASALHCKPSDLWLTTERLVDEGAQKKRR